MSNAPETRFTVSNKLGGIFLQGLEEIMGRNGLNALMNLSGLPELLEDEAKPNQETEFTFEELAKTLVTLEQMYGPRGGHGVALRAGRACFKYCLHEFGPELGLNDSAFRLLPADRKLVAELERLAKVFNTHSDQRVRVQEGAGQILWQIERCPMCWERHVDSPVCHLVVGLLQEASYWVSGGRMYNVEEKSCIALGDPTCTVLVDVQPYS